MRTLQKEYIAPEVYGLLVTLRTPALLSSDKSRGYVSRLDSAVTFYKEPVLSF